MLCIIQSNTEPYYNMAVEEYLLNNFEEDIFLLWQNEPVVVVGRYQNTIAEINLDFIKEKGVKVVRRLTGGGAVFHDLGNLNFTFIKNGADADFKVFTQPIIGLLNSLGVDARFEGRNDITIDGKKISGNAMLVSNNRTMEHGTLLFSSQMADLSAALKTNPLKFEDKAVKSIRSRVTNISEYLKTAMDVIEFRDRIMDYIIENEQGCTKYDFTEDDTQNITKLKNEKYETWDWNFGTSPSYSFAKMIRTTGGNVEIHMNILKGVISEIKLFGDFFGKNINKLEERLKGTPHNENAVANKLNEIGLADYLNNINTEELLKGFF